MSIGENIKKYRKQKNMTQQQLANAIDKSKSTIEKYEADKIKNLSFETLKKIATILQVPIDILCGQDLEAINVFDIDQFTKVTWYKNKTNGEILYEDLDDCLQLEMAKTMLTPGTFEQIQAIKTFLFYTSEYNLSYIKDSEGVKIKLTNIATEKTIAILTVHEVLNLFTKIKYHVESEIKYIEYLNEESF